jgi:hypothetical protein
MKKEEAKPVKKKLVVKSVKHVPVKSGVRAGGTGTTHDFTSSKNSNNGEGWQQ